MNKRSPDHTVSQSTDVISWRKATRVEVSQFLERKKERKGGGSDLVIRSKLSQADVYTYLRVRFGKPNGLQTLLRSDDSDNLVHWDFNLKAGAVDVYLQGRMRDVMVIVSESMTDEAWKLLILNMKADFARTARDKSKMQKSFEKFIVFQNKYVALAEQCADLHASIIDTTSSRPKLPKLTSRASLARYKSTMTKVAKATNTIYGDCLKLKLLTPIMAEAYLNMMILILCKPDIRADRSKYEAFLREKIPQRLEQLPIYCQGFSRAIDTKAPSYRAFLRVMNGRNFAIHGNVDPVREPIETVYFEGKVPIFTENGNHILTLFEHLESINKPDEVVADYEAVHDFLIDLRNMLEAKFASFIDQVINDPYPGYEMRAKRVTKILPERVAAMEFPNEKYDDELRVSW